MHVQIYINLYISVMCTLIHMHIYIHISELTNIKHIKVKIKSKNTEVKIIEE